MNLQSIKLVVTSIDGAKFVVETDQKAAHFETAFAATKTAAELTAHGDFAPVSLSRALVPHVAAPEFVFEAPRICGPLERRQAFRLIKGGKPS